MEDGVRLASITGFHSVGSRSVLASWVSVGIWMEGIVLVGTRVGVMGATIVRGERGGEVGGVVEDMLDMEGMDAERGLQESLRRQLGCISRCFIDQRIELLTLHCSRGGNCSGR